MWEVLWPRYCGWEEGLLEHSIHALNDTDQRSSLCPQKLLGLDLLRYQLLYLPSMLKIKKPSVIDYHHLNTHRIVF